MYKIIRSILIIAAIMLCTAVCVYANYEYSISGNMITRYNGNADIVLVPSVIDGVEIAGIDTNAFQNKDMHTVIIEDGIEVVQPKAFVGCDNLEYVKSPDSMLLINENAFFECFSLSKLDVSDNTYVMSNNALSLLSETESENYNGFLYSGNTITGYVGEDTDIIIPDIINGETITTIAESAFAGNTAITSVTIPDTVTTIGNYAFKECTSVTEVSLSRNLTSAGVEIFNGCSSLKSITIPGTLNKISQKMFYGCKALTDVVLENGVTGIGPYSFYECQNLENIQVPETITTLETWAFGYCYKLESFFIPDKVTSIGSATFYLCKKLNNIIIPDSVTGIGTHAFRGCSQLANIKISENIEIIQYRSFNGCGFSEIKIPEKVTSIDSESFYQCQKLVSIQIPDNVTSIGKNAFYGCFRLKECIIYGEDVSFGEDPFLYVADDCKIWVPANSNTSKSAEEKSISCSYIQNYASVTEQQLYVNDTLISTDTSLSVKKGDKIFVKYNVITSNDTDNNNILFAFLLYDSNNMFLGMRPADVELFANSKKTIENSVEIGEEAYIKVVLFNSLTEIKPLCAAIGN